MNINQVSFCGRLGGAPELRYTESGKVLCKISVAVRRRDGSDTADWFTCKAWGKVAEIIANHTDKGSLVEIEGNLSFECWENSDGENLSQHVISVQNINLLGSRKLDQ